MGQEPWKVTEKRKGPTLDRVDEAEGLEGKQEAKLGRPLCVGGRPRVGGRLHTGLQWGVYPRTSLRKQVQGLKQTDCEKWLRYRTVSISSVPQEQKCRVGGKTGHKHQPQDASLPGSPPTLAAVPSRLAPGPPHIRALGWRRLQLGETQPRAPG